MAAVCPNPHTPADAEMVERLLGEMRQYRGEYGIYAAEMLVTARLLLEQSGRYPRQAEAAAYCIRQAVGEIFGDTRDPERTDALLDIIVDAKDIMQTTGAIDDGMLQNLYMAVDNLKEYRCSPKPENRLKKIFRQSSGIDPEDGLIREYRRVKKKSNDLMHRAREMRTDIGKVRDHYEEVVDTLALIFLPTERLARIERLAELSEPQKSDFDELRRIMKNAHGFDHFAKRMISPAWFAMMEPDTLKSPSGNPPWLLGSLAWHLKDEHVDAFISMFGENFDLWVSDEAGLGELGFVGYRLGDNGLPWLVKTLQVSQEVRMKRDEKIKARLATDPPDPKLIEEIERMGGSIRHLDDYARRAFLKIKQPNSEFIELAEHLLSSASTVDAYHKTNNIPAKLVEGMDRESAIRIVEILVRELRAKPESGQRPWIPRLDSIDGPDYDRSFGIKGQVASLCEALAKARNLGVPTPRLIEMLGSLPEATRPRFEAWLYSRADDVAASEIVRYVVTACGSRHSNEEDDLLLDRLKRDGRIRDISEQIASLLGRAPDTKKMDGHLLQWGITTEERWHILWARTMRPWVELPDEWKPCLCIVDGFFEAGHDSGGWQAPEAPETQDDAIPPDKYSIDDPLKAAAEIAAEEPSADGFLEPAEGHSPVSDLESMVRSNVSGWVQDPASIIRTLRRPEYVAGYLRGLAGAREALDSHADRIIFAVKFSRDLQWDDGASGSTTFYHDGEFTSVHMVGMMLIKKVVKNDIGLGKDALADVWSVVIDAVVCPDPETDEQPDYSTEYLHTVYGLPHVRAVRTLFEVIRYAKRNNVDVEKAALARIAKAIRLTGKYGVDYHACIGPEALFLRWVDPDWFEQNEQYLFGSTASAELGRVALDTHLAQLRPAEFILVKYRDGVLDAVKRDVHMALHHLLGCLLYGTSGYDPEYVAKSLLKIGPEYVSKTGWHVVKLLPKGANADHVRRGVAFWDSILKHSPKPKPEALAGFGWWADVPGIDQERWEELMMRTCEMTEKLDWSQRVAERISLSQTITDAGWKILARLISIDLGHDKPEVAKHAMDALRKTVNTDAPESRSHLCEVLADRSFHEAAKF